MACGISMYRSVATSCSMSAIGNSGARSGGVSGSCVPGFRCGGSGSGKSALRLYQCVGTVDGMATPSGSVERAGTFAGLGWSRVLTVSSFVLEVGDGGEHIERTCGAGPVAPVADLWETSLEMAA